MTKFSSFLIDLKWILILSDNICEIWGSWAAQIFPNVQGNKYTIVNIQRTHWGPKFRADTGGVWPPKDSPGTQGHSRDAQLSSGPIPWVLSTFNRCWLGFGAVAPEGAPLAACPGGGGAASMVSLGWVCGSREVTS